MKKPISSEYTLLLGLGATEPDFDFKIVGELSPP